MRLVLTLLVRDEADIVDANIAFHLNAGVDFVIATDHRSVDGTTEILEEYARDGVLRLIREREETFRQSEWVTRMAHIAATELGADWVLNSDADEFWLARDGTLKEVFEYVPERFGVVFGLWRHFAPRPGTEAFSERMVVRLCASSAYVREHPAFVTARKAAHRASATAVVGSGNHDVCLVPYRERLRSWYPIDVLHFPLRTCAQATRKYRTLRMVEDGELRSRGPAYEAVDPARAGELYDSLVLDDAAVRRGLADGSLVIDTRVRDALRNLGASGLRRRGSIYPAPDAVPGTPDGSCDRSLLIDIDAIAALDSVERTVRRLHAAEERIATLERALRLFRRSTSGSHGIGVLP